MYTYTGPGVCRQVSKSVHLYRTFLLLLLLEKVYTYICPVLTYCKLCTPIPATTAAGRFQKVCTYTGHNNSRHPPSKSVHLYRPPPPPAIFQKCTPIYTPFCPAANCAHLYQPRPLPASFFKSVHLYVPRRRPHFAGRPHALSGYALILWPV